MTPNMKATMESLKALGFVCNGCNGCETCIRARFDANASTELATLVSRAFDRGNYASAYESGDLDSFDLDEMSDYERAAFVLGFFSSHTLDEIGSEDREVFDECYHSLAGRYVVHVAKYCDPRDEEYRAEMAGAL